MVVNAAANVKNFDLALHMQKEFSKNKNLLANKNNKFDDRINSSGS